MKKLTASMFALFLLVSLSPVLASNKPVDVEHGSEKMQNKMQTRLLVEKQDSVKETEEEKEERIKEREEKMQKKYSKRTMLMTKQFEKKVEVFQSKQKEDVLVKTYPILLEKIEKIRLRVQLQNNMPEEIKALRLEFINAIYDVISDELNALTWEEDDTTLGTGTVETGTIDEGTGTIVTTDEETGTIDEGTGTIDEGTGTIVTTDEENEDSSEEDVD